MAKTITISVEEGVERDFRKFAGVKYGRRKGYLGKAVTEAMREWVRAQNEKVVAKALALLKTGIKTSSSWKFNRDELHER